MSGLVKSISPKSVMARSQGLRSFSSDFFDQDGDAFGFEQAYSHSYGMNGSETSIEVMDMDLDNGVSQGLLLDDPAFREEEGDGPHHHQFLLNDHPLYSTTTATSTSFVGKETWQFPDAKNSMAVDNFLTKSPSTSPKRPRTTTASTAPVVVAAVVAAKATEPSSPPSDDSGETMALPHGVLQLLGEIDNGGEAPSLSLDLKERYSGIIKWLSSKYVKGGSKALEASLILSHTSDGMTYSRWGDPHGEQMSMLTGAFFERLRSLFNKNQKNVGIENFLFSHGMGGPPNEIYLAVLQTLVKRHSPVCGRDTPLFPFVVSMVREITPEGNPFHHIHEKHVETYVKWAFTYYSCHHALKIVMADSSVPEGEKRTLQASFDAFTAAINFALEASSGLKTSKKTTKPGAAGRQTPATPAFYPMTPVTPAYFNTDMEGNDYEGGGEQDSSGLFKTPQYLSVRNDLTEGMGMEEGATVSVYNIKGRKRDESFCKCSVAHHGLIIYNNLGYLVETFRISVNLMFSRYQGPDFHKSSSVDYRLVFRCLMAEMFNKFDTAPLRSSPKIINGGIGMEIMDPAMEFHELLPTFDDSLEMMDKVEKHYQGRTATIDHVSKTALTLLRALGTNPSAPPPSTSTSASTSSPATTKGGAKRKSAPLFISETPVVSSPLSSFQQDEPPGTPQAESNKKRKTKRQS